MWRAWISENHCTQEFLLSYDLLLVSLYLLVVLYPSDSTNSCIFSKFLIQLSQEINGDKLPYVACPVSSPLYTQETHGDSQMKAGNYSRMEQWTTCQDMESK